MRLDWWVTHNYAVAEAVKNEAVAFTNSRDKIFLVESQEEYDLASALQYIHGGAVAIKIVGRASWADVEAYRKEHQLVYTSWDPLDPNRI